MKKQFKLGIIGCGFMATAILNGVLDTEFLRARKIIVSDLDHAKLDSVSDERGVNVTDDNKYLVENSEFVLLAIKPQNLAALVEELGGLYPDKVISIMAGVKKSVIKNSLGVGIIRVARCMPNLPCSVRLGAMAVDMTDFNNNTDDTDFISNLFNCLGEMISVTEDKLDAVTGVSGSGPAYTFLFMDSLIDAGMKNGLSADEAKTLALQTVLGSAAMAMQSEKSLPELIRSVCSKGGTTIEAVKIFEQRDFRKIVGEAVDACVKRSEELSK